jgi:hypothetical protein
LIGRNCQNENSLQLSLQAIQVEPKGIAFIFIDAFASSDADLSCGNTTARACVVNYAFSDIDSDIANRFSDG